MKRPILAKILQLVGVHSQTGVDDMYILTGQIGWWSQNELKHRLHTIKTGGVITWPTANTWLNNVKCRTGNDTQRACKIDLIILDKHWHWKEHYLIWNFESLMVIFKLDNHKLDCCFISNNLMTKSWSLSYKIWKSVTHWLKTRRYWFLRNELNLKTSKQLP